MRSVIEDKDIMVKKHDSFKEHIKTSVKFMKEILRNFYNPY